MVRVNRRKRIIERLTSRGWVKVKNLPVHPRTIPSTGNTPDEAYDRAKKAVENM